MLNTFGIAYAADVGQPPQWDCEVAGSREEAIHFLIWEMAAMADGLRDWGEQEDHVIADRLDTAARKLPASQAKNVTTVIYEPGGWRTKWCVWPLG